MEGVCNKKYWHRIYSFLFVVNRHNLGHPTLDRTLPLVKHWDLLSMYSDWRIGLENTYYRVFHSEMRETKAFDGHWKLNFH